MSDLTNWEKRKFEKLLGMGTGYVADFTNRTFADFISDSTGLHIYDARYQSGSGSKAHRLRAFWALEDNPTVGKLMSDMLDYCSEDTRLKQEAEQCRGIVERLLQNGRPPKDAPLAPDRAASTPLLERSKELRQLKDSFLELAAESDRKRAGLALEKLLNRLFELFELQPRQPFRATR